MDETFVYPAIVTDYRGFAVYETAPVSQGFLLLSQLNILEGFDLRSLPLVGTDRIHLSIEAKKLAFEDRNLHAGDPAFVDWPLAKLIGKEHAARRRAEIDPANARLPEVLVPEHAADTSYFAVVDRDGNAISFIHSLSAGFGSGVVAGLEQRARPAYIRENAVGHSDRNEARAGQARPVSRDIVCPSPRPRRETRQSPSASAAYTHAQYHRCGDGELERL